MARSAPQLCPLLCTMLVAVAFVAFDSLADPMSRLRAQQPRESLGALLDGTGFAKIPAGEYQMGSAGGTSSERPVHRVKVSKGFEIGKFEVTQAQWEAVMATAHPSTDPAKSASPVAAPASDANPSHFKGSTLPVENVSWNDVQRFLTRLNARDAKHVYRLPTEAEWEYAARAGRTDDAADELGWFQANSDGQTHPIGQKQPNAWGLYDTQGNVSEWVNDWFALDYYEESPAADPLGPPSGSYRTYRGCSWLGPASDCRPAARLFNFPNDGYYNVGFRLVRTER